MATSVDSETEEALKFCMILLEEECDKPQRDTAINTLLKIFRNVLSHPTETKYQELRVENATFNDRVWRFAGAQQFLIATGWGQVEEKVLLLDQRFVRMAVRVLEESQSENVLCNYFECVKEKIEDLGLFGMSCKTDGKKEKLLEETRRKQFEKMKREKEEKRRIAEQIKADRRETQSRPITDSVARHLSNHGQINRFDDIGVDLNSGGG